MVFGGVGVAKGTAGVLGSAGAGASVDSEFRFFAAWYAVVGSLALRAASRPEEHAQAVRTLSAGFGLASIGRLLSWRRVGRPHGLFALLTALEAAIAAVLVPWQRRLERRYQPAHADP
jgi:hypothetical protein